MPAFRKGPVGTVCVGSGGSVSKMTHMSGAWYGRMKDRLSWDY